MSGCRSRARLLLNGLVVSHHIEILCPPDWFASRQALIQAQEAASGLLDIWVAPGGRSGKVVLYVVRDELCTGGSERLHIRIGAKMARSCRRDVRGIALTVIGG